MSFKLVSMINAGFCPECQGWSCRMWVQVRSASRQTIVCCEACGPKEDR